MSSLFIPLLLLLALLLMVRLLQLVARIVYRLTDCAIGKSEDGVKP